MAEKKPNLKSGSSNGNAAKSSIKKTGKPTPVNSGKSKMTGSKKKSPKEPDHPSLNDFTLPEGETIDTLGSPTVVYHFYEFIEKYKISRNTAKMWLNKRWLGHSPIGGLCFIRELDFFRMLRHFFKPPFYDLVLLFPFLGDLDFGMFL